MRAPPDAPYRDGTSRPAPTLTSLPLAEACGVEWDDMLGNGRVRRCAKCRKQVFNISGLSLADAEVLVRGRLERDGGPLHRRSDGGVVAGACARGRWRRPMRRATTIGLGVLAVLIGCALLIRTMGSKVSTAVSDDPGAWEPQERRYTFDPRLPRELTVPDRKAASASSRPEAPPRD
jgi:hypothetical protein